MGMIKNVGGITFGILLLSCLGADNMYFRFVGRHLECAELINVGNCWTYVNQGGNGRKCRNCLWSFVYIMPGNGYTLFRRNQFTSGLYPAVLEFRIVAKLAIDDTLFIWTGVAKTVLCPSEFFRYARLLSKGDFRLAAAILDVEMFPDVAGGY